MTRETAPHAKLIIKPYTDSNIRRGDLVRDDNGEVWTFIQEHGSGDEAVVLELERKNPSTGEKENQNLKLWLK